jgi:hypothetical protein
MRPHHPVVVVVGFASSAAAAAAVLPPAQPLVTDPLLLLLLWMTTAFAVGALARADQGHVLIAASALLNLGCVLTISIEAIRSRRWERPGLLLLLLGLGLASWTPAAYRWLLDRAPKAEQTTVVAGPRWPAPWPPQVRPVTDDATRVLAGHPAGTGRILHDRWLLEPGPLTSADKGGFGALYRAVDLDQPIRRVVVKLASRPFGVADDNVARLRREGDLLRRLDSPNVVKLLDSGWEAGVFFLVLQYHPLGSLAGWLERQFVVELATATGITCEVLRALTYLHDGGQGPVIHRDVTPRNLLLRTAQPTLRLLLTDFGSARRRTAAGALTDPAITIGSVFSPFYAPPELVGGTNHGWSGPQTDVYGACAILYELLTGLAPYQREARRQDIEFSSLVLDPTVLPTPPSRITPNLPVVLDDVVAAGLAFDPAARIARARDLLPLLDEVGRHHGGRRIAFAELRGRA